MYREKTITATEQTGCDSTRGGPGCDSTVAEPEVPSAVAADLKLESELAASETAGTAETAATVETPKHIVYAISVSDHRKYGCTRCGCKNGSGSFVAEGMMIWNCMECGHGNVILTKDTKESPLGIGVPPIQKQTFFIRTEHPRSAEPHKLPADFDTDAEPVKGIGIFQTERGCFVCDGGKGEQNLLFGIAIQLRDKPAIPSRVQNVINICGGCLHSSDAKKLKEMTMRFIVCACVGHMTNLMELLQILNDRGIKNMDSKTFLDIRKIKP